MTTGDQPVAVLDRLYGTILERRGADPTRSHTAALLASGPARIAQKAGEEAIETVIAATTGDRQALVRESADLVYHLMVLWAAVDVRPDTIWQELIAREGVSGVAEKAARQTAANAKREPEE